MSDLQTVYIDFAQGADLALDNLVLADDDGLLTAVLISLFTDRQARPDDVLPGADVGDDDRRGWWGDDFSDDPSDQIGSRLWLNEAAKQLTAVLRRDRTYAEEALQWLIDDGIADRVEVATFAPRNGIRAMTVAIYRPAQTVARFQFSNFWEGRDGL